MTEKNLTYLEVKISGRVQGVSFRYFIKRQANKFGIKGFCRNEIDGSVFFISSGEKENQEKFLKKLQKGPLFARVDNLEVREIPEFREESFKIL